MAVVLKARNTVINNLPENILLEVFTYLSVKDLCTSARVCCKWRRIIGDNRLWRHVDLRPWRINLNKMWKVIRAHFSKVLLTLRMAGNLDQNAVEWKRNSISKAMLTDLQDRCPELQTLELIKTNMSNVTIENLPQKLTTLIITHSMIPPGWFQNLNQEDVLPHLTMVDLSFSSKTSNRDLKDLSQKVNLKVLKVNGCYRINEDGLKTVAEKMTKLETLEIAECSCGESVFHIMCRNMINLKRLNLSICKGVTGGCLDCIGKGLSCLEWLDISGCEQIMDKHLPHLQQLKLLESLKVKNTNVTPEGIHKLQGVLPKCSIHI